jgi:hypothetical protein
VAAAFGGIVDALAVLDLGVLAPSDADVDTDALCLRAELLAGQRLHEGAGRSTCRPMNGSTVGVLSAADRRLLDSQISKGGKPPKVVQSQAIRLRVCLRRLDSLDLTLFANCRRPRFT